MRCLVLGSGQVRKPPYSPWMQKAEHHTMLLPYPGKLNLLHLCACLRLGERAGYRQVFVCLRSWNCTDGTPADLSL